MGFVWFVLIILVCVSSSPALRDLWWNRLGQAVKDERDKEPKTTTIQITYHDAATAIGYVSPFESNTHNGRLLIRRAERERERYLPPSSMRGE